MKEKIKKYCKEHPVDVGIAIGTIAMVIVVKSNQRKLARQGYMTVRPVGYDHNGMLHVQNTKGRQFHVHNHNK